MNVKLFPYKTYFKVVPSPSHNGCTSSLRMFLVPSLLLICFFDTFRQVNASDVIILEGILLFHDPRVRSFMDMKIFVDAGPKRIYFFLHLDN